MLFQNLPHVKQTKVSAPYNQSGGCTNRGNDSMGLMSSYLSKLGHVLLVCSVRKHWVETKVSSSLSIQGNKLIFPSTQIRGHLWEQNSYWCLLSPHAQILSFLASLTCTQDFTHPLKKKPKPNQTKQFKTHCCLNSYKPKHCPKAI